MKALILLDSADVRNDVHPTLPDKRSQPRSAYRGTVVPTLAHVISSAGLLVSLFHAKKS